MWHQTPQSDVSPVLADVYTYANTVGWDGTNTQWFPLGMSIIIVLSLGFHGELLHKMNLHGFYLSFLSSDCNGDGSVPCPHCRQSSGSHRHTKRRPSELRSTEATQTTYGPHMIMYGPHMIVHIYIHIYLAECWYISISVQAMLLPVGSPYVRDETKLPEKAAPSPFKLTNSNLKKGEHHLCSQTNDGKPSDCTPE